MPSAKLKSASAWQRLESRRLLSLFSYIAATVLAAWLSYSSMSHQLRAQGMDAGRGRVQLNVQTLANTVYSAMLPGAAETEGQAVKDAEMALRRELDGIISASQSQPGLTSTAEALRDYLLGPMHEYHERLFHDSSVDSSSRISIFSTRHEAVYKSWEPLFFRFSAQVDHAIHDEEDASKSLFTTGLVLVPVLLVIGLVGGWGGSSGIGRAGAISSAIKRLRQGDFAHKLAWDRDDEFGEAAREIDGLSEDLAVSVPEARKSASITAGVGAQITEYAKEQHERLTGLSARASELAASSGRLQTNAEAAARQAVQLQEGVGATAQVSEAATASAVRYEAAAKSLSESSVATLDKLGVVMETTEAVMPQIATINKVADQANLLSLNAAIEAEKAGEYGLGFAVVAMEIRRFAEQTIAAADELDRTSRDLQSILSAAADAAQKSAGEASGAAKSAEEVVSSLTRIVRQLEMLGPISGEGIRNAREQTTGMQGLAEALSTLSRDLQKSCSDGQPQAVVQELENSVRALNASLARWEDKSK